MASFFLGSFEGLGDLLDGGRPAERLLQVGGHPPPLEQQLDHVRRDADRLGRIHQGPLDRLLDPVAGIGAEPRPDGGVEALDGPEQAEVPFLDQVLEGQSLADIAPGDVDDQAEVGPDHPVARHLVALGDPVSQFLLLVGGQQGHLVDLPEVGLQGALHRVTAVSANTGHEDPRCVGRNWVRCHPRAMEKDFVVTGFRRLPAPSRLSCQRAQSHPSVAGSSQRQRLLLRATPRQSLGNPTEILMRTCATLAVPARLERTPMSTRPIRRPCTWPTPPDPVDPRSLRRCRFDTTIYRTLDLGNLR